MTHLVTRTLAVKFAVKIIFSKFSVFLLNKKFLFILLVISPKGIILKQLHTIQMNNDRPVYIVIDQ